MEFNNKTVLITGASSGIGEEFAIQLANYGANLILTARSENTLETLASRLRASNPTIWVKVLALDLCEAQSVQSLYSKISSMDCSVDYLINNAGAGRFCHFVEEDYDVYQKMIDLNISALTELTYAFLPDMKEKNSGGIIHVASIASFQPLPYQAVYGATKAYVLNFSEALSGELLNSNVHVMALCPGITESNFMKNANADVSKMKFSSASHVVNTALTAFQKRRIFAVDGLSNYLTSLLPRVLPRLKTVKIVVNMFKDTIPGV